MSVKKNIYFETLILFLRKKEKKKTLIGLMMMQYQKIIMRRKERVSVMNLISGRKKQCAHVDGQEVGAVTASNRNGLEHTSARHAHLKHQQKGKRKKKGHYRR